MKKDIYKIENSIQRLLSNRHTLFLDQNEFKIINTKIKKDKYKIYLPYKTSEKVILYTKDIPNVSLFKINSYEKLRHQDILGSILSLNISPSFLGDIIVDDNNYYFYILSELSNFIKDNFNKIGNKNITLEQIDLSLLEEYERKYEENEIIVSSIRIDTVISRIINKSRTDVIDKIKNKEILLNYEILNKNSYILKENDIFSIRKFGKYKFVGIKGNTKKDNLIIKYLKYM